MKLFFYRKFIRFVIKHFTIVINNTIQMNGGQYIEPVGGISLAHI